MICLCDNWFVLLLYFYSFFASFARPLFGRFYDNDTISCDTLSYVLTLGPGSCVLGFNSGVGSAGPRRVCDKEK